MNRVRRALAGALALALPLTLAPARAHPLPDTQITVSRTAAEIALRIRLPAKELMLALPQGLPRDAQLLVSRRQAELRRYFAAHLRVIGRDGRPLPVVIQSIRLHADHDQDVGKYAQLEVRAAVRVTAATPVRLRYDAILHRVANHRAVVKDGAGRPVGVIRYSLATKRADALRLP